MWKVQHMDGCGDQRAARSRRAAREVDHGVRGCHPQLLRSGISCEGGRHSRPLQHDVVRGDEAGHIPLFCARNCTATARG
jgi:hypothetical protein